MQADAQLDIFEWRRGEGLQYRDVCDGACMCVHYKTYRPTSKLTIPAAMQLKILLRSIYIGNSPTSVTCEGNFRLSPLSLVLKHAVPAWIYTHACPRAQPGEMCWNILIHFQ